MNVCVTGASGFLGLYVCEKLIIDRHNVIAAVRDTSNIIKHKIHSKLKDIRLFDLDKIDNFDLSGVDTIIHCAAYLPESFADDSKAEREKCMQYNALATYQLLQKAEISGIKTFIYISSGQIYDWEQREAKETDLICTDYRAVAYLKSKELGDENVRLHRVKSAMRIVILRPSSIYGYRMKNSGLLPRLINKIHSNQSVKISNYFVDLVDVEDVADMIGISVNKEIEGIYNVGGGNPILTSDLINKLYEMILNKRSPYRALTKLDIEIGHPSLNIAKAKLIGYSPRSLNESLKRFPSTSRRRVALALSPRQIPENLIRTYSKSILDIY